MKLNIKTTLLLAAVLCSPGCAWTTDLENGARVQSVTNLFAPSVSVYEVPEKYPYLPYVVGGQSVISQLSGPMSAAVLGPFLELGRRGGGNSNAGSRSLPLSPQSIGIKNNIKIDSTNLNYNVNEVDLGGY